MSYRPDEGPRRYVFGFGLPTLHGLKELELVAAFVERTNEINVDA